MLNTLMQTSTAVFLLRKNAEPIFTRDVHHASTCKLNKIWSEPKTFWKLCLRARVESVLSFNRIMSYGNLNSARRNALQQIMNTASKIIGNKSSYVESMMNSSEVKLTE